MSKGMQKVRLGVIGAGGQGCNFIKMLTGVQVHPNGAKGPRLDFEQIELGAICEIDPERVARAKQLLPEIPVFTDYIEMLESGMVDAIITCVPHYLHPQMGIEALNRGIHAMLEKPAGVYSKQVQEVIDVAASKPELTFAIMFNQRSNPLYIKVKQLIDRGAIGKLRRVNWIITTWYRPTAYYNMSDWRATWAGEGGGVLVNQAPHQIDLMQWLCGMPKKVYADVKYGYARNIEVEDEVTAMFEFEDGATGVFVTCTHDPAGTDRLEIMGDKGKIIVDKSSNAKLISFETSEPELDFNIKDEATVLRFMSGGGLKAIVPTYIKEEDIEIEANAWGGQHAVVLRNFADNILHQTPLLAPGSDGIKGVKIANAIHLSSWLGKKVEIDHDPELYYQMLQEKIAQETSEK